MMQDTVIMKRVLKANPKILTLEKNIIISVMFLYLICIYLLPFHACYL